MKKLTQASVSRMPRHEQLSAYISHDYNKGLSKRHPSNPGLSFAAQSALWNDWRLAISEWSWRLPAR